MILVEKKRKKEDQVILLIDFQAHLPPVLNMSKTASNILLLAVGASVINSVMANNLQAAAAAGVIGSFLSPLPQYCDEVKQILLCSFHEINIILCLDPLDVDEQIQKPVPTDSSNVYGEVNWNK